MAGDGRAVLPAGVLVALVTPLDGAGGVDDGALDRLLQRVLAAGVTGISPTGSTGEGARLTRAQRVHVLDAVRARVPDGFPVIAGVPVAAVDDAIVELDVLGSHGASAALVAPPSYHLASGDDLERLYGLLAEQSSVPLVLYNIPAMTKTPIPPAVVASLARHPRIVGIKDSSRDLEYLQAVIYAAEGADFQVMTGSDTLLFASLLLGAHGAIAASANLVPQLGVSLYDAVRGGDPQTARDAQRQLFTIVHACRRGIAPAGWKAALEIAGLCSARLVAPAARLPDEDYRALSDDLHRLLPVAQLA